MHKVKSLIMFSLVLALSFALIGCGFIASTPTDSEQVTVESTEVPEWLLLSHRSAEGPESEIEDEPESMEDEETVAEPAEESTQTAQAAEPQQTAPSSNQAAPAPQAEKSSDDNTLKPGTREYAVYLQHRKPGETPAEFLKRVKEEKKKAEEKNSGDWFDDMESPSGFGKSDDDD